jgi:[methyl-Co(III) methanol-specific corrinoid protein]:coenzyme M methyltransferase
MTEMTERERVRAAYSLEEVDRPAVTGKTVITPELFMRTGVNPAGLFDRAKDVVALAKDAHDYYGFENYEVFQIWSHAEYLGLEIEYNAPNPFVKKTPYALGGEFEMPDMDKYLKDPKIQNVVEGYRMLREVAGKDGAVNGITSWGPLTMAGHLVGTENLMLGIATDPEEVKKIIKFCAEFDAEAYKLELSPGNMDVLDFLAVAEPTASGDLVSPEMFEEFALPYNKIEQGAIHSSGMLSEIHICGDTTANLPIMAQTGANGLSIEQKVDPYSAVKLVGGKVALCGNVGPVMPLWQGDVQQVKSDTNRCVDAGFRVIQPGCSIAMESPAENLRAMTETTKASKRRIPKGA